jgi:hypothetical protein
MPVLVILMDSMYPQGTYLIEYILFSKKESEIYG